MIKRICMIAVVLMFCVLAIGAGDGGSLTVLIYMTGSDLESLGGAASRDLEEMVASVPKDDRLSVVVMTGGASEWKSDIPYDRNTVWHVQPAGLALISSEGSQSMGDPRTLSDFLTWGVRAFPAQRYALILWDHGAGPLGGLCFDEQHLQDGVADSLSLDELTVALKDSPFSKNKLSLIGFDACLMSSFEVAVSVAPYAEYMVASQEPEPVSGWDYRFLSHLVGKSTGDLGHVIIDAYADSVRDSLSTATLSCIDLSEVDALKHEISSLFQNFGETMSLQRYQKFAECRSMTKTLGASTVADWDLVDLADLADMLEEAELADTSALRAVLNRAVVCNYANEPYVNGLSIYYPFDNKLRYSQPWSLRYTDMDVPEPYLNFMYQFSRYWLGESRSTWQDKASIQAARHDQKTSVTVQLSDQEVFETIKARMLVLERVADGEYQLIYIDENPELYGNELYGEYEGDALFLLDRNDDILAGPLSWSGVEGGLATYSVLENLDWGWESAYLIWKPNKDGQYLLTEIETYNDAADMFTKSSRVLREGETVLIGGYAHRLPDTDIRCEEWPWGDMITYSPVTISEDSAPAGWHLEFLPLQSAYDRFALFEITDLHANVHLTSLTELENPNKTVLQDTPLTAEDAGMQLTLSRVSLLTGSEPGLLFDFRLAVEGEPSTYLQSVSLNQTTLYDPFPLQDEGKTPAGETCYSLLLREEDLRRSRVEQLSTITLNLVLYADEAPEKNATFSFPLPLDLGILVPPPSEAEPISAVDAGELHFELISLEKDSAGNLTGELHVVNRDSGSKTMTVSGACVNGTELFGDIAKNSPYQKMLSEGHDAWCRYIIYTMDYIDNHAVEILPLPELSEIHQLSFQLEIDGSLHTLDFPIS